MQFLTALFGGSENTLLNAAFALGIVLVLVLFGLQQLHHAATPAQARYNHHPETRIPGSHDPGSD